MMKLGLVGPLPPPSGGMAMQTQQLARLLEAEGVDVQLVQTNAPYSPKFAEKVKGVRALVRLLPYLWRVWRLSGRVDVVHLMANSGWSWQLFAAPVIWIGWLRRTPVIVNYRGGEAREYLSASAASVKPTLAKASHLVVPSAFLQEVFGEFGITSSVIPNIIDLETFRPAPPPGGNSTITIAITRNLEAIYGLDTAILAMAEVVQKVPVAVLKIAGSGPQLSELEQLVESLGLSDHVEFLGRLDRPGIVALYQSADMMLNPSTVDNMPNSVLEAMACGLPTVSTDVGGVPYIVRDGYSALLVPAGNVSAMAEAIVSLCNDEDLRQELAKNAMSQVEQYSWPNVRQQWLAMYKDRSMAA